MSGSQQNSVSLSSSAQSRKRPAAVSGSIPSVKKNRFGSDQTYPASGLKHSLHGNIYQLKLLMLFLKRASDKKYDFRLATEWDDAEKFDDLVFRFKDDNGKTSYRFLQAKHKLDENKKIGIGDLLTQDKGGEFNLEKYFISYLKIKHNQQFSPYDLEDFIICTNIGFDIGDSITTETKLNTLSRGKNSGKEISLKMINSQDDFFKDGGKRYKLEENPTLISHLDKSDEVDKAIKDNKLNINKKAEISEFIKKLVFAVEQPSETKLTHIIEKDLGEQFNVGDADFIAGNLLKGMLDWMKEKGSKGAEGRFLSASDSEYFFQQVEEKISKLSIAGMTSSYSEKLNADHIFFQADKLTGISTFIGQDQKQFLHLAVTGEPRLSAIKVNQALKKHLGYITKDSYIFMPLEDLLYLKAAVIDAFGSENTGNLLIINCKKSLCDSQSLYDELKEIIKSNPNKKIILIAKQEAALANRFKRDAEIGGMYQILHDTIKGLADIDIALSNEVLKKEIIFQGVKIHLDELIGHNYDLVDEEILSKLVDGLEKVKIAFEVHKLSELDRHCYIERTFSHAQRQGSIQAKDVADKIVIISAVPGMGKSVTLTHLAQQEKMTHPSTWVIKINLIEHKNALNSENFDHYTQEDSINFLSKLIGLSDFENRLFKNSFNQENKISLFFDGFDEINAVEKDNLLILLKNLKTTKIKKLWITTRVYAAEKLESALEVSVYKLNAFAKNEKEEFLNKFSNFNPGVSSDSILKEIEIDSKFTGVPLNLKLLAEGFDETHALPNNFYLYDLYKKFIKKKFKEFNSEKQKNINAVEILGYKEFISQSELLALYSLFGEEAIALFYPNKIRDKNKLISNMKNRKGCIEVGLIDRVIDERPYFIHYTFAEYFSGRALAKIVKNFFEPSEKQREFIEKIFETENERIVYFFDSHLAETPLHKAIINNLDSNHIINDLSDDLIDQADKMGRTPLSLTAAYGEDEAMKRLLARGANVNSRDTFLGWSALSFADAYFYGSDGNKATLNTIELILQDNDFLSEDMHFILEMMDEPAAQKDILKEAEENNCIHLSERLIAYQNEATSFCPGRARRNIDRMLCVDSRDEENIIEKMAFIETSFLLTEAAQKNKNIFFSKESAFRDDSFVSKEGQRKPFINAVMSSPTAMKQLHHAAKLSAWSMHGMMYKNLLADIINGNEEGIVVNLGFIASSLVLSKLAEHTAMQGLKFSAEGKVYLGQALRMSSPFLSRVTSVFIVYDLVNQVKALKAGNLDALVGIVSDGVIISMDVAEIGIETAEIFGLFEGVSSITGPIGAGIGTVIFIGTDIYSAVKAVEKENRIIHLTAWEKFKEGWRSFLHLKLENYLEELIDEKQVNNRLLNTTIEFLRQHTDFKYSIFPTGKSVVDTCEIIEKKGLSCSGRWCVYPIKSIKNCTYKIVEDLSSVVLLDKKTQVSWSRAIPDAPNEGALFCWPLGAGGGSGSGYFSHHAMGLAYTSHRTGEHALFALKQGDDKAIGFQESPNVFRVEEGHKHFMGGNKDDVFILSGYNITGLLDGGAGNNRLDLASFAANVSYLNIQLYSDISINSSISWRTNPLVSLFGSQRDNVQYSDYHIDIKNIQSVFAREGKQDIIWCNFDTQYIDGRGGENKANPDIIYMDDYPSPSEQTMVVRANTTINNANQSKNSKFSYVIFPDLGESTIQLKADVTRPWHTLHHFLFNATLEDLMKINVDTLQAGEVGYSNNDDVVKNINFIFSLPLFNREEGFNLSISNIHSNASYVLLDNTEIKMDKNNYLYALQNSNKTIDEILDHYPAIANRLNMTISVQLLNEVIIVGHGKHEVLHNNPEQDTHLLANGGENIYKILPSHKTVTIYAINEQMAINTIDLRPIVKEIIARSSDYVYRDNVIVFEWFNDLYICVQEKEQGETIYHAKVMLKNGVSNYQKVQVFLMHAPMRIESGGDNWILSPVPLTFDSNAKHIIITGDDVEAATQLILQREAGQYNFFRLRSDLIIMGGLDLGEENGFTLFLSNFYKTPKLKTLSIKCNDTELVLKDKREQIRSAISYCSSSLQINQLFSFNTSDLLDFQGCFSFTSKKIVAFKFDNDIVFLSDQGTLSLRNYYPRPLDLLFLLNDKFIKPSTFKALINNILPVRYYLPNDSLKIYHNQPLNKKQLGLIDLRHLSLLDCDMKIVADKLILSTKNKTILEMKNWRRYSKARKIVFIFNNTFVLDTKCLMTSCAPEVILEAFQQAKIQASTNTINKNITLAFTRHDHSIGPDAQPMIRTTRHAASGGYGSGILAGLVSMVGVVTAAAGFLFSRRYYLRPNPVVVNAARAAVMLPLLELPTVQAQAAFEHSGGSNRGLPFASDANATRKTMEITKPSMDEALQLLTVGVLKLTGNKLHQFKQHREITLAEAQAYAAVLADKIECVVNEAKLNLLDKQSDQHAWQAQQTLQSQLIRALIQETALEAVIIDYIDSVYFWPIDPLLQEGILSKIKEMIESAPPAMQERSEEKPYSSGRACFFKVVANDNAFANTKNQNTCFLK